MALRLEVSALDDPQARAFRYDFDADRSEILLGRRGGVDVLLPQPKVSLVHARIDHRGDDYFLVDDGSSSGSRLNGVPVTPRQRVQLHDGDTIGIGDFVIQVSLQEADGFPETAASVARRMVREVLERLGPAETQPTLTVLDGPQAGAALTLPDPARAYMLGRGEHSDLRLDDVDMWREHAALVRDDHGVTVRDLGASARLTVNGHSVDGAQLLRDGDVLVIGTTSLRFGDPAEVYLRKLEREPAPDEPTGPERAAARAARPELALAAIGVLLAVGAAVALVYVLLW